MKDLLVISDAFPTRQYVRRADDGYSLHGNIAAATMMDRAQSEHAVSTLAQHGIAAIAVYAAAARRSELAAR